MGAQRGRQQLAAEQGSTPVTHDEAERHQRIREGQNAEADLRLEQQDEGANPADGTVVGPALLLDKDVVDAVGGLGNGDGCALWAGPGENRLARRAAGPLGEPLSTAHLLMRTPSSHARRYRLRGSVDGNLDPVGVGSGELLGVALGDDRRQRRLARRGRASS